MSFMEIEEEWAKEKAARQAVEQVHTQKKSRRWIWAVVAAVVVVGGLVAAGVYVQMHAKKGPIHETELPAGLIGIEIRSSRRALISVDGHKVGRAPVTIHVPRSASPVGISDGRTTKAVIPDHDQRVDFTE